MLIITFVIDDIPTTLYYPLGLVPLYCFFLALSKTKKITKRITVPSHVTLTRTKLPGVLFNADAKTMLGVGKAIPNLNLHF